MLDISPTMLKTIQQSPSAITIKKNEVFSRLKKIFSRLNIAKKISYGYCLAIGVGVTGTAIGLFLGDYHQNRALFNLRIVEKQQSTIIELENALKTLQAHPQQLMTVLGNPISLDYERVKFFDNLNQIQRQIQQFEMLSEGYYSHVAINDQDIQFLENAYETTIKNYVDWIDSWWTEKNLIQLDPNEISLAQKQIWNTLRSDRATQLSFEFERLSEHLTQLQAKAEAQQHQSNLQFNHARRLRLQIVFGSMLISTLIAVLLALLTSSAIANPIQRLTQVAQNMTEDANLSLRASVDSQDEVGRLSQSLNQLIQWVETYTDELQESRQTLEERVEERTHELQQALQELKTTQAQLIHTEKMFGLGQMVGGVAHEINNPINFISANISYLREYTDSIWNVIAAYQTEYPHPPSHLQDLIEESDLEFLQEDLSKILNSMQTGSDRIRDIVLSLRTFSRLDEAEIKSVDLHAGIDSALLLLKHRLEVQKHSPEIQVIRNYGTLPKVNCHASQLNQVFMNILNNGIDALRAKVLTHQQPILEIKTEKTPQDRVKIAITDNGIGMDEATLNHIFDPFFTTKPIGSGTGLGLSTSYQIIVEQHKGRLSCTSSLDRGTTFMIEIPL